MTESERTQWEERLAVWRARLRAWGLEGLASALLEAAEPFGVIGAQALYVAQPTLGIFVPAQSVERWARLLEDPANIAWMRARLADESDTSDGLNH